MGYFKIFRNISEYSEIIFRNISEYLKIFRNISKYFGIFWNISEYSKIFRNIPKYSGIFQNISKIIFFRPGYVKKVFLGHLQADGPASGRSLRLGKSSWLQ